jgi:DNA topoisomerase VI subunit B
MQTQTQLLRTTFTTDRRTEFFTAGELTMQLGYGRPMWPLVLVKELIDNALDACEATDVAPEIAVELKADSITVSDNGPGLKQSIIAMSLDYDKRVSDKKNYVAPTRGQLGNALKCLWAAPFVSTGRKSVVEISAGGLNHRVEVDIDRITQKPRTKHYTTPQPTVKNGTSVNVHWPEVASLPTSEENAEFYQSTVRGSLPELVRDFATLNPHASFALNVCGKNSTFKARDRSWRKWRTSDPTSAHWYRAEDLRELVAAYIRSGKRLTVRDFVSEFDGLTGTQYRKRVLQEAELTDACLADLVAGSDVDMACVGRLLEAMQRNSRPPKPQRLGVIGKDNLRSALVALGVDSQGFEYAKAAQVGDDDGLPYVIETAFGVSRDRGEKRKLIIGLNNSPVFRVTSTHLSEALSNCHVQTFDPVVLLIHQSSPRFAFLGHGKGSVA